MPCTAKKTFEAAREANSHLLVQVKENQPGLLRAIEDVVDRDAPLARHEATDRPCRMRVETRIVEVFEAGPALEETTWNGLITRIIRVQRMTLQRCAKDGLWDRSEETCLYVCSAAVSARKASDAIRSHWGIENRNHYVRDVSMFEDASRIRVNPGIFARARSFALNILRANGEKNIADALWRNALDFNRPIAYRFK